MVSTFLNGPCPVWNYIYFNNNDNNNIIDIAPNIAPIIIIKCSKKCSMAL